MEMDDGCCVEDFRESVLDWFFSEFTNILSIRFAFGIQIEKNVTSSLDPLHLFHFHLRPALLHVCLGTLVVAQCLTTALTLSPAPVDCQGDLHIYNTAIYP
jgi:hypothetical protein